jgi:hypothetical protein
MAEWVMRKARARSAAFRAGLSCDAGASLKELSVPVLVSGLSVVVYTR